ncbi:selenocysteine insertion sequence-binding protein 2 [Eupeodes corollae]|uniref:selenocysteine insertion sequence-binding protein 2 n=1 Tax=Eupeodes corollae TaxID=290404 RepID=UPI002490E48E|nr:selenocysteine insertion sequence-binding protein 2 [Eupeodes corollae]
MSKSTAGFGVTSDKLRLIDENTYNQFCQSSQVPTIKKYKRSQQIPNLSQFINIRCHYKQKRLSKQKPTALAIYKAEKKSVRKSKAKKKSKLKKCILKYRLHKRSHIETENSSSREFLLPAGSEIADKLENLTLQEEAPSTSTKKNVHSRRFREYCDNTTSEELNGVVETLLRKLNHFQKRAFKINNFKGKSRRRIVIGFREVQVQMKIEKIKCVIIATDCEKCDFEEGIDNIILEIKEECTKSDIPCVFAFQRRKLSYVLHQKCPTSCVGIIDYDGAQDSFYQLVERLAVEKSKYSNLFK